MLPNAVPTVMEREMSAVAPSPLRRRMDFAVTEPSRITSHQTEGQMSYRQAELFYLQKQIQSQTPMVIVLLDGERIEGCIEWYDRRVLKVRSRLKMLIYKSAIKYMYKLVDSGQ